MSHPVSWRSADDVISIANDITMTINCDVSMWKVTYNLLDIYFTHGDIHGWLCKKFKVLLCFVILWLYHEFRALIQYEYVVLAV